MYEATRKTVNKVVNTCIDVPRTWYNSGISFSLPTLPNLPTLPTLPSSNIFTSTLGNSPTSPTKLSSIDQKTSDSEIPGTPSNFDRLGKTPHPTYELIKGHTLRTRYALPNGIIRESTLDLDNCIREKDFRIQVVSAPEDLRNRTSTHIPPHKLSESLAQGDCEAWLGVDNDGSPVLSYRKKAFAFGGSVQNSAVNLGEYLRKSSDGHLEFVHPCYKDDFPRWLHTISGILPSIRQMYENVKKKNLEVSVDRLSELWWNWLNASGKGLAPDIRAWMKGTYVDQQLMLIRRGS